MKLIIKLAPELTIKSRPVRKRLIKQLKQNLKIICQRLSEEVRIEGQWDSLQLELPPGLKEGLEQELIDAVANTPGISHFFEAREYQLGSLDDVLEKALPVFRSMIEGKTFCLRVKRVGKHDFSSLDAERYIGGGLNQHTGAAGVSVSAPEVTLNIEIRHDIFYLIEGRHQGLGGFPIGSQDTTLTLMSGGFDSTVAAYLIMKRGIRTHFLFFNLGGEAHEVGVKQVAHYIWQKFGSSHRVQFITVNFEPVVEEILTRVENSLMGVVLKRAMYRAADRVADRLRVDSFVTGEAIAQVSSQTMANLNIIDQVSDKMVLRPLIVSEKLDIIQTARKIGTAEMAEAMPEFCGVISKKPTTRARPDKLLAEELKMDWQILDSVLESAEVVGIEQLADVKTGEQNYELVSALPEKAVLIDIRHPSEVESVPCPVSASDKLEIPFFRVRSKFAELDDSKHYVLYCDRGVMSKMQAQYLVGDGYFNVSVWQG